MTAELLMMHGIMSQLPPEKREVIEAIAKQLRELAKGDEGQLALALVAVEIQNDNQP